MFNEDFYPTPENVILQMMEGYDIHGKVFLEPEAGKADIVDYLNLNGAKEVLACEINEDLRKILNTKCKVIGSDFLTITSDMISHVDMIVMNPPFSRDVDHILHAWNIAPDGCDIVSLLNENTLSNPFSGKRKELSLIISENGRSSDLGPCFSNSERKTGVNVSMISLRKSGESYSNEFKGFFLDEDPEEDQMIGLMPYNVVRDLVNRYVESVKIYDKQLKLGVQMNALTSGFYGSSLGINITNEGIPTSRAAFKKDLQKSGWKFIFSKMKMDKLSTRSLRDDINNFVEKQNEIPFTMKNIYHMLDMVRQTTGQRMDKAILDVFTRLTKHYHKNRYGVEGWKTNDNYLINQKVIIPNMCAVDKWHTGSTLCNAYGSYFELIEDLVKAICFITGDDWDTIGSLSKRIRYKHKLVHSRTIEYFNDSKHSYGSVESRIEELKGNHIPYEHIIQDTPEYGKDFEWSYFEIRAYKKGTMHFKFKDTHVWELFNQRVAKIMGYPLFESTPKSRESSNKKERVKVKPVVLRKFKVPVL
jgi:hypothetical protein